MADSTPKMPIIDSHIHVYPLSQIDTLAWCKPGHPLAGQRSVEQYRAAADDGELRGFIFIETDRKNGDGKDWEQPLAEVEWLARIATGRARPGEGAGPDDAPLCLAAVPWAPVASGPDAVDEFLGQARQRAGSEAVWRKVRGVRFLVQDKPHGTMVDDAFIGSLRLLGRKGLVFDLGVDQHRRGRAQLEEAVDMIDKAHDGVPEDEKVVFILSACLFSSSTYLCSPLVISYLHNPLVICLASQSARRPLTPDRPPLQARPHHHQPHRPGLHRLAHGHVHAVAVLAGVHEAQRSVRGDARGAARAAGRGHLHGPVPLAGRAAGRLRPVAHHVRQRLARVHGGRRRRRLAQVARRRRPHVLHGLAVRRGAGHGVERHGRQGLRHRAGPGRRVGGQRGLSCCSTHIPVTPKTTRTTRGLLYRGWIRAFLYRGYLPRYLPP